MNFSLAVLSIQGLWLLPVLYQIFHTGIVSLVQPGGNNPPFFRPDARSTCPLQGTPSHLGRFPGILSVCLSPAGASLGKDGRTPPQAAPTSNPAFTPRRRTKTRKDFRCLLDRAAHFFRKVFNPGTYGRDQGGAFLETQEAVAAKTLRQKMAHLTERTLF